MIKLPRLEKDISSCAVFGMMSEEGRKMDCSGAVKAIALMHERSNGLGGGFAAYGIYPEYADSYAFHLFYDNENSKKITEEFLNKSFEVKKDEEIPTKKTAGIKNEPILWRYFLKARENNHESSIDDFVVKSVMYINSQISGSYVVSSGKNMGVFKAAGFPEDVAEFYRLDKYQAYSWTAHGRFPTNSPGWWGGSHPFGLLDLTVVHNGEISSYGTNKRYLEMFGYKCELLTDTEVITYLFDLLLRKHKLPLEIACKAVASPFWEDIERMERKEQELLKTLRIVYASALVNGPFAIVLGHSKGLVGLTDRVKLRPLVAARKDDMLYLSSEESGIKEVCKNPDRLWMPKAGEPVIGELKNKDGSNL